MRVSLLGRVAVEVGGREIPAEAWKRKRPLELLKLVALAGAAGVHREELIDRLWPDKDLDAGANNLHRALHDLRQVVGDDAVVLDKGIVRLAHDAWVDVVAFEDALVRGDDDGRRAAVELYRGPLCPDDPYSDALSAHRERLRQKLVDAALALAPRLAAPEPEQAMAVLRRLTDVDPANEEGQRQLMRLLAEAGRSQDALRQFAALTAALRESHDGAPSAETMRLRETILRGDVRAPASARPGWQRIARRLLGTGEPTPLRGREAALAEVKAFAEAGEGVLLLLGEAGVGKTRLAVEAARLCAQGGATVLAGAASDLGVGAPYLPFIDAWSEWARACGAAVDIPFLRPPAAGGARDGGDDKLRLFQAAEASLRAIGGGQPVCLIIEDLHWLDESSLQLLHFLARAGRGREILLVATCREEEVRLGSPLHTLIAALRREKLCRRVLLERLDRAATRALIADLTGGEPPAALAGDVYALTGGNPFYAEELVRARKDKEQDKQQEQAGGIPADLANAIRARVQRHGPAVESLLTAGAVLGTRFAFEDARAVAGLAPPAALDALEAALAARFLDEDEGAYRFRHALLREAVYGALSRPRRVMLHQAAAAALAARAGDAHGELAHHHREGGQLAQALPHLVAAGKLAARRLGLREAVGFFEQALAAMDELGVPAGPQRFEVLDRAGKARLALSDIEACVRDFDRAAGLGSETWAPSAGEKARAWRLASLALLTGGLVAEARARLDKAVRALAGTPADPEWPNVLYHLAQLYWHEGSYREAYAAAERCLQAAEQHGDAASIARGYEMLALACHTLGEWKQGAAFEDKRQQLTGGPVDVAQSFDVHL